MRRWSGLSIHAATVAAAVLRPATPHASTSPIRHEQERLA